MQVKCNHDQMKCAIIEILVTFGIITGQQKEIVNCCPVN